jgi:hypothetical protein
MGRFGGHIKRGARTQNKLTFHLDHLVGADQLALPRAERDEPRSA